MSNQVLGGGSLATMLARYSSVRGIPLALFCFGLHSLDRGEEGEGGGVEVEPEWGAGLGEWAWDEMGGDVKVEIEGRCARQGDDKLMVAATEEQALEGAGNE